MDQPPTPTAEHALPSRPAAASLAAAAGARELQRVLEVLPVRVARYDREFRFRYANRLHRRFFGLDEHRELRGVPLQEVIGREAFDFVRPYFVQALAGTPTGYQREVRVPSGERWIQVWLMPDFDFADDEIGGVLAASVDITDRRRAEQRAIHARAQLRDALHSIEDGFVLFDADDRLVVCNERYRELCPDSGDVVRPGARFEDILRHVVRRGRIAAASGREEAWIEQRLAQHRAAEGSHEQELADGRWTRISEKRTADGGTVGLYVDITELKQAHQRLRASMRMLEKTVEHLPMGVSVVGADLRLAAFNDAFLRLHELQESGVRPGDPLERIYRAVALRGDYGPGDPDALVEARMALAREGHALRFERLRPDGRVIEVFRDPLPGGGFVTLYADVTQRKENERRIVEAREHAEATARAKSEFIASVGQEIRTPLNGVLGLADLLLQSRLDAGQRRHVEWLQRSARSLLSTLGGLLDSSDLASGATAVSRAAFDLRAAIRDEAGAWAPRAASRRLSFVVRVGEDVPSGVVGDGPRLRQVLGHLIGNALKFTPAGEVSLDVECRGATPAEALVAFRIRDSGIGIPKALRDRLFQSVDTGPAVPARRPGSGLGIAACRQVVHLMGGRLDIDSAPGRGTEFRFELRFPVGVTEPIATAAPTRLDGRVLVVEDCPITREVTRAALERCGLAVVEAPNGREAMTRLQEGRFDLVLMDVEMPELDGIAATRALRASEAGGASRTPVVALTASARERTRAACALAGMDGFVAKPVDPAALRAAIAPYLAASAGPRTLPATGQPALDRAVFEALADLMGDDLPQLVGAYATAARDHVSALRRALRDADPSAMFRPAHTLKSSSANVGAVALTALAAQVEALARTGRTDGAEAIVDEIERALECVCAEIGAGAPALEAVDGTR